MTNKIDKKIMNLPEILNWIVIFISPTLIGLIVGLLVYFNLDGDFGKVVGIFIIILGIVGGVKFAECARKKEGTNNFMTRLHSTTETKNETNKLNDL